MKVYGVCGKNGSGKTTVCNLLKEKGYLVISLSQFIKENLQMCKKPATRENMIEEGNRLRKTYTSDYLARLAHQLIQCKNCVAGIVIDSIRNDKEIEYLKKNLNLKLIYIDTEITSRYHRILERNLQCELPKDVLKNIQQFKKDEMIEFQSSHDYSQQLVKVFDMKDYTIINNESLDELSEIVNLLV